MIPKIRKNYGAVRAESIRTDAWTDARTDARKYESKSIVPPKFLGRSKNIWSQTKTVEISLHTFHDKTLFALGKRIKLCFLFFTKEFHIPCIPSNYSFFIRRKNLKLCFLFVIIFREREREGERIRINDNYIYIYIIVNNWHQIYYIIIDIKFTINKSYHTAIHSLRVLLS